MEELNAANGVIPVLTPFIVGLIKKSFSDLRGFNRIVQFLPILVAFGLTWVPGIGLVSASIGMKLLVAAAAGGLASNAYEIKKQVFKK